MTKIIRTQEEMEALIVDGVVDIDDDLVVICDIQIEASINARNINARDIKAEDIDAWNIHAEDIDARDIDAGNINARDIKAGDIDAGDIDARHIDARHIKARDIDARHIKAWNIHAGDINYYTVCFSYQTFKCNSVTGSREEGCKHFCLGGDIIIKKEVKND